MSRELGVLGWPRSSCSPDKGHTGASAEWGRVREQYLRCYPWDQGRRWGPGVQRGLGHQGSQERQQYQEHPVGGRIG